MPRRFLRAWLRPIGPLIALLVLPAGLELVHAQRMEGDLRIAVRDSTGLALRARVVVANRVAGFEAEAHCDTDGRVRFRRLPLGLLQVQVHHPNFQPRSEQIAISSALPLVRNIVLNVASVEDDADDSRCRAFARHRSDRDRVSVGS